MPMNQIFTVKRQVFRINELPCGKLRGIERPNRKTSRGKLRGIEPDEINIRTDGSGE